MPPSSAHRILKSLQDIGLVRTNRASQYGLSVSFMAFIQLMSSRQPAWQDATQELERVVAEYDETAILGIYDPERRQMMFVSSVDSTQPIRYVAPVERRWIPVHAGSSGLAILAFLPEDEIDAVIASGLASLTPNTITDARALREEIARVRERGYAISMAQRFDDAVGVAAPILGDDGLPIGDIIVTFPSSRQALGGHDIDEIGKFLVASADRLARRWTSTSPAPPSRNRSHNIGSR